MHDTPQTIKLGKRVFTVLFPSLLRQLSQDERASLRRSIQRRGVEQPILVDENDGVIDGINRLTIAAELGHSNILTRVVTPKGMTLEEKRLIASEVNDARRHMKPHERRELAESMERLKQQAAELRAGGATLQEAAKATGLSPNTVKAATAPVLQDCKTGQPPPRVTGKDGKSYPARKPRTPKSEPSEKTSKPRDEMPIADDLEEPEAEADPAMSVDEELGEIRHVIPLLSTPALTELRRRIDAIIATRGG